MNADDKVLTQQYQKKATECFELAKIATDERRVLFMELAEMWAKMALQVEGLPPEASNVTRLSDRREHH